REGWGLRHHVGELAAVDVHGGAVAVAATPQPGTDPAQFLAVDLLRLHIVGHGELKHARAGELLRHAPGHAALRAQPERPPAVAVPVLPDHIRREVGAARGGRAQRVVGCLGALDVDRHLRARLRENLLVREVEGAARLHRLPEREERLAGVELFRPGIGYIRLYAFHLNTDCTRVELRRREFA